MKMVRVFAVAAAILCESFHGGGSSAVEPPGLSGTAEGSPHCTSFSPDSRWLVTQATSDNSLSGLLVFDVQTRSVVQSLQLPGGGRVPFHCVATSFSGDGKWLAAAGADSPELLVWDRTGNMPLRRRTAERTTRSSCGRSNHRSKCVGQAIIERGIRSIVRAST